MGRRNVAAALLVELEYHLVAVVDKVNPGV
jgi:hypothetical protein